MNTINEAAVTGDGGIMIDDEGDVQGLGRPAPAKPGSKPGSRPLACLALFVVVLLGACNGLSYDPTLFSDDEWISKEGDTYSYVQRSMQHSGTGQTRGLALAFSGFYGKHSVWMIEAAADAMVTAETVIAVGLKGQYKVCLVDPDRQVRILADKPGYPAA